MRMPRQNECAVVVSTPVKIEPPTTNADGTGVRDELGLFTPAADILARRPPFAGLLYAG